jgi:hypothetical protein
MAKKTSLSALAAFCCYIAVLVVGPAPVPAQKGKQPNVPKTDLNLAGTVKEVGAGLFQVADDAGELWVVKVEARPMDIRYTGSADGSFLRPGMFVRITSKLDRRGVTADKVTDWTVFTQSPDTPPGIKAESGRTIGPGLFVDPKDEKKPKSKTTYDPTYEIAGRISKISRTEVTIDAGGTQVRAQLAEMANVSLDLTDLSFLRPGDKVELSGWHVTDEKGRYWATRVTATASSSLSDRAAKKSKSK